MTTMPTYAYLYMIIRDEKNVPRGAIAMRNANGSLYAFAMSFCNPIEPFNKKDSRNRTFGRLNSEAFSAHIEQKVLESYTENNALTELTAYWTTSTCGKVPHNISKILKNNSTKFLRTMKKFFIDVEEDEKNFLENSHTLPSTIEIDELLDQASGKVPLASKKKIAKLPIMASIKGKKK